jgi:hypothetical protein
LPGSQATFSAELTKGGKYVYDSYTVIYLVNGVDGTSINPNSGVLTVAGNVTQSPTVSATIFYDGAQYTGTKSVTLLNAAKIEAAVNAIANATNDTQIAKLQDFSNLVGMPAAFIVNDNKASYSTNIKPLASDTSTSLSSKINSIRKAILSSNQCVLVTNVSDKSADEIKALFTEPTLFASVQGDNLWL